MAYIYSLDPSSSVSPFTSYFQTRPGVELRSFYLHFCLSQSPHGNDFYALRIVLQKARFTSFLNFKQWIPGPPDANRFTVRDTTTFEHVCRAHATTNTFPLGRLAFYSCRTIFPRKGDQGHDIPPNVTSPELSFSTGRPLRFRISTQPRTTIPTALPPYCLCSR